MFPAEPAAPKRGKKGRKSAPDGDDGDLPAPVDVLVDAAIGFLEKGTAYLRAAANQAFALLSGAATASTIDLVLTVSAASLRAPKFVCRGAASARASERPSPRPGPWPGAAALGDPRRAVLAASGRVAYRA